MKKGIYVEGIFEIWNWILLISVYLLLLAAIQDITNAAVWWSFFSHILSCKILWMWSNMYWEIIYLCEYTEIKDIGEKINTQQRVK